jgi:hypothetical protein
MPDLINMPVSRKTMQKYQNRYMKQIEHMAKQWEARESKVKNNYERKKWLERQNNANYRNEYNRIVNYLEHTRRPFMNETQLENRKKELQKLFSSGNV